MKGNIDKKLIQQYSEYLKEIDKKWENNEELDYIKDMISYSIQQRELMDVNYQEITNVLKGEVFSPEVKDLFTNDITDTEALAIMNSKAAIFDVQNINVELKPKSINLNKDELQQAEILTNIGDFNRILNDAYLSKPKFSTVISEAIKYSRGYPMAVTLLGWDDNAILGSDTNLKGDITCENVPIENFWWDAASNDIDTCEYCFVVKMLPYQRVKQFVKNLKDGDLQLLEAFHCLVKNYQDTVNTMGSNNIITEDDLMVAGALQVLCFFKRQKQGNDYVVKVSYFLGRRYLLGTQILNIPYLPFAILKEQSAPNAFTGISSVMLAINSIRKKAFLDGCCTNILTQQKSPIYIVNASSGININELVNTQSSDGAKVLTTNSNVGDSVYLLPNPQINNDMLVYRNALIQDIQRVVGSSDVANGVNFGSAISGAATQAMIDQATQRENTSITELYKYIVRFVRIVMFFIKEALLKVSKGRTTQFRVNNIQDNKGEDLNNILIYENGFEWLKDFEADIDLDVSYLRASKKSKQQQDLVQLYQIEKQYNNGSNSIITMEDIAETLNLPNKQQILNRIKANSEQEKLMKATDLVNTVFALMETPDIQQLGVEQAVSLALEAQTNPEVRAQLNNLITSYQQQAQYQQQVVNQQIQSLMGEQTDNPNENQQGVSNE